MQHWAEDGHVRLGQGIEEKVTGLKPDPIGYSHGSGGVLEPLPSHRQIETDSRQTGLNTRAASAPSAQPTSTRE